MEENVKENPKKHGKKLKTFLIVLLVIFAILLVNFIRNVIIVKSLSNKTKAYENCENFHLKWSTYSVEELTIFDVYYKDGKFLQQVITNTIDEDTKIRFYVDKSGKTIVYNDTEKTVATRENDEISPLTPSNFSHIAMNEENFLEFIKFCFTTGITSQKCNDRDCYKIGRFNLYVDKETGLSVRGKSGTKVNGKNLDVLTDIMYEFNTVKDEDVIVPKEEGYRSLDDNEIETKSTDSVMKAIIVKVNENDLLVVPTNKLEELYSVSLKGIENKEFKRNQEIEIFWNGDILTIYPGQINNVSKIDIVKEETDEEISEKVLRFCYSKVDNVSAKINEFTLDKIKFTITDKNEIPYTYNKEDFKLYKKEPNENYTGVGQKVGEETEHSTAGYTGTGSPYNWEKVGFQDDLLKDGVMNISKDNQNIAFEIDLEKAYGNLESGEYYFILSEINIHIRINFEINENGELTYSEPKVEW